MKRIFTCIFLLAIHFDAYGMISGQLENGMTYLIEQNEADFSEIQLKVNVGFSSENEIERGLNQILAFALLQETEIFKFEDIQNLLHECREDISSAAHIQIGPDATYFTFRLPANHQSLTQRVLTLTQQISEHGTLSLGALELARKEAIEFMRSLDENDPGGGLLALINFLCTFTQSQLKDYYREHYNPEAMHLIIKGPEDEHNQEALVFDIFGPLSNYTETPLSLSCNKCCNTVIVDGKILMNKPSWSNTRWWGTAISAVLGVIAAGCLMAGISFPPLIAFSFIPMIAGIYYYVDPYLKDPSVVEEKRKEDLVKGFRYAYIKKRAGITLTPFERRNLFIVENSSQEDPYPDEFHKFAIADLADIYDLNDPVISAFLYPEELNQLQNIKQEFILQRNNIKMAKKILDDELNKHLTLYQTERDRQLDKALKVYEDNIAVQLMRQITKEWEESIASLQEEYEEERISTDEFDELLANLSDYYESLLSEPNLLVQVQEANEELNWKQQLIVQKYQERVSFAKYTINYDERLALIESGKETLFFYFTNLFTCEVCSMALNDASFPDFLDLRKELL